LVRGVAHRVTSGDRIIIGEPIGFVRDNYALSLSLYRVDERTAVKTPLTSSSSASSPPQSISSTPHHHHVIAKRQTVETSVRVLYSTILLQCLTIF
jgi:hypothetical protein